MKNALCHKIKAAIHQEGGFAGLFLGIGLFFISSTQEIIYTNPIEICQCVQYRNGDIQSAQFIIRIGRLMDLQKVGKVFLLLVPIVAQVTETGLLHYNHPGFIMHQGIFPY